MADHPLVPSKERIAEMRSRNARAAFAPDLRLLIQINTEDVPLLLAGVEHLRTLLRDMVDPDPCYFDHNGGCQAHGYLNLKPGEMCPHAEAKAVLGEG